VAFRFRYERLLRYRADQERQALMRLGTVQKRLQREYQNLQELENEAQRARENWASFIGRSRTMDEIRLARSRRTAVEEDVHQQKKVVGEWESRFEKARQEWVEARRSKKMIELLKEKDLKAYRTAVSRAETQHLDEVSSRPFALERGSADTAGGVGTWTGSGP
jgi:flagellar FliJ protein